MRDSSSIDLGSIQVHKKVVEEIIEAAISDMNGVTLLERDVVQKFLDVFRRKSNPGINIKVGKEGQVCVEVKVLIAYGLNIPDVARQIQNVIKEALDKMIDVELSDINVNIQGIERGEK